MGQPKDQCGKKHSRCALRSLVAPRIPNMAALSRGVNRRPRFPVPPPRYPMLRIGPCWPTQSVNVSKPLECLVSGGMGEEMRGEKGATHKLQMEWNLRAPYLSYWRPVGFRGGSAVGHLAHPTSFPIVAIAPPPRKYKTFRNHRNVRYWEKGEENRKRKEQKRKTAQKRLGSRAGYHYIGAPWGSVGFRWVPRLPIWPTPSLLPAIVAITLPTRKIPDVAKPPKRLVWGEGRRKGENGKSKIGKRPKKGCV